MDVGKMVVSGSSKANKLLQQYFSSYLILLFVIIVVAIDASSSDRNYNRRHYSSANSRPLSDEITSGHPHNDEEYSMYDIEFTMYEDGEEEDGANVDNDEDEWPAIKDWETNTEQAYGDSSAAEEERILLALERATEGQSQGDTSKKRMGDPSFARRERPYQPNVSSRTNNKNPTPNDRTMATTGQNEKIPLPKRRPSHEMRSPSNRIFRRKDYDTDKSKDTVMPTYSQENPHSEHNGKPSSAITPSSEGPSQQYQEQHTRNHSGINYMNSNSFPSSGLPQGGQWPTAADASIPRQQSYPAQQNTSREGMQRSRYVPERSSTVTGATSTAHIPHPIPPDSPQFGSSFVTNPQSIPAAIPATPTATTPANAAATTPWIRQFLATRPKDVLLPIPLDYLSDGFNLVQLAPIVERIGLETLARAGEDPVEVAKRLQQLQHQIGGASTTSSKAYQHPIYKTALKLILRPEKEEAMLAPSTATMSEMPQQPKQQQEDISRVATLAQPGHVQQQQHDIHSPNQPSQHVAVDEDPLLALIPAPALQRAAEALYLMVHARFVTSPRGLESIRRILMTSSKSSSKIQGQQFQHHAVFGRCPRISCHGMPLLPYGDDNDYHSLSASSVQSTNKQLPRYNYFQHRCKRYCCSCGEVFYCWDSKTDGCAWGPSFCHLFLLAHGQQVFPQVVVERQQQEQQKRHQTTKEAMATAIGLPASSTSEDSSPSAREGRAAESASSNQCRRQVYGFDIHPGTPWGQPPR